MTRKISILLLLIIFFTSLCGCNGEKDCKTSSVALGVIESLNQNTEVSYAVETSHQNSVSSNVSSTLESVEVSTSVNSKDYESLNESSGVSSTTSIVSNVTDTSSAVLSHLSESEIKVEHPKLKIIKMGDKPRNKVYKPEENTKYYWAENNTDWLVEIRKGRSRQRNGGEMAEDLLALLEGAKVLGKETAPEYNEYYSLDPGVTLFRTTTSTYYLDLNVDKLYHVESGNLLEVTEELKKFVNETLYYYPQDYYFGYYIEGDLILEHRYKGYTDVKMEIKDIYAYSARTPRNYANNYVTVELTSKAKTELDITTRCYFSDDNIGFGESKKIKLKPNVPKRVTLEFGWGNTLVVIGANRRYTIMLQHIEEDYSVLSTHEDISKALKSHKKYDHSKLKVNIESTVPDNKMYDYSDRLPSSDDQELVSISVMDYDKWPLYYGSDSYCGQLGEDLVRRLSNAKVKSKKLPKKYDDAVEIKTKTDTYYTSPKFEELYHIEGKRVLEISKKFKKLLTNTVCYYPYNCYKGKFNKGNLNLRHVYKAKAKNDIELTIKDLYYFGKNEENYVIIELLSKETQVTSCNVRSFYPDQIYGEIEESRCVYLEAGKPKTATLKFGYCDIIRVYAGNNMIEIDLGNK